MLNLKIMQDLIFIPCSTVPCADLSLLELKNKWVTYFTAGSVS